MFDKQITPSLLETFANIYLFGRAQPCLETFGLYIVSRIKAILLRLTLWLICTQEGLWSPRIANII